MSSIRIFKKGELKTLAEEWDIEILSSDTKADIIKKIEGSEFYNEAEMIQQLTETREEIRETAERKLKLEKEKAEREFELEKLRIEQGENVSFSSERGENNRKVKSLKSVMPGFDPEKNDMALFLILFERQAKKAKIEEGDWVTQLLTLMPADIAEVIIREPEDKSENFQHMKKILLDRYKLSPEAFRTKFTQHQKKQGSLWKDLIFELRAYLDGWLSGLDIDDFSKLKQLLITDQLKRRASPEIRDQLFDKWSKFVDPEELAAKLDEYELLKRPRKNFLERKSEGKFSDKARDNEIAKEEKGSRKFEKNWRDKDTVEKDRSKIFEKRQSPRCYECDSTSHLKYQCPKLQKTGFVNNLCSSIDLESSFAPYLSKEIVNGSLTTIFRDSGSSIDVIPEKFINKEQFSGETIWIKQTFENRFKCLPLANVEIKMKDIGKFRTKAAVVDSSVEMNHYLLGNQSFELIQQIKNNQKSVNKEIILKHRENAKGKENEPLFKAPSNILHEINSIQESGRSGPEKVNNDLTPLEKANDSVEGLTGVSAEDFCVKQKESIDLILVSEKFQREEIFIGQDLLFMKTLKPHRELEENCQEVVQKKERVRIPPGFEGSERLTVLNFGLVGTNSREVDRSSKNSEQNKSVESGFGNSEIEKDGRGLGSLLQGRLLLFFEADQLTSMRNNKTEARKLREIVMLSYERVRNVLKRLFDYEMRKEKESGVGAPHTSEKRNEYLLTEICLVSKYPGAIPVVDRESEGRNDTVSEKNCNLIREEVKFRDLPQDVNSEVFRKYVQKIEVFENEVHGNVNSSNFGNDRFLTKRFESNFDVLREIKENDEIFDKLNCGLAKVRNRRRRRDYFNGKVNKSNFYKVSYIAGTLSYEIPLWWNYGNEEVVRDFKRDYKGLLLKIKMN